MEEFLSSPLFKNTLDVLHRTAKFANISENVVERLRAPRRAITVAIPVRMDNEKIKTFIGYRVQHNQTLGPFKGGIRYHHHVNLGEVAALASLMTYKNSLMGLPLGGAKGGVAVNPSDLSKFELQRLTRNMTSELRPFIGPDKDIPAPDVGTDSQTMAWMMDTFSSEYGYVQPGVVTGKPVEIGGSYGREASTGLGVVYIAERGLATLGRKVPGATFAIQGFGKVGMHAGIEANLLGGKVLAVSDVNGAICNESGLDIPDLVRYMNETKTVVGYPKSKPITNAQLLEMEVDVLAPCALDNVINENNAKNISAKVIVEGANGPVNAGADFILNEKKILVVPDILANGGGVVVSYFEWVQDISWLFWSEDEVRGKLKTVMNRAFDKVWEESQTYKCSLRTAAMGVSLKRLEKAMKLRGLAW